jgi:glycosyltransferase involved in cell wall biosynthesis
MRVCMISPHLPPEQAANALLPRQLGDELSIHGVIASYVSHPPAEPKNAQAGVVYVPRRGRGRFDRSSPGALVAGGRMAVGAQETVRASDLVHLHGNGFLVEVGRFLAERYGKPYVITLYGTDVWHHDESRHARFGRAVRGAAERVFYSQGLLDFAKPLNLAPEPSQVIYAPVPSTFHVLEPLRRDALRRDFGVGGAPLLLTVKRLHEVAGHDVLLRALPMIFREHPGTQAWIIGDGELRPILEAQARALGIASQVRFMGLMDNATLWRYYVAADLFVLPSRLESWGTVMLEALACGTPVVAAGTAGAAEVHRHFPEDVMVAEKENPQALAEAVCAGLTAGRRTLDATRQRLQTEFSVSVCAARYLDVYRRATHAV